MPPALSSRIQDDFSVPDWDLISPLSDYYDEFQPLQTGASYHVLLSSAAVPVPVDDAMMPSEDGISASEIYPTLTSVSSSTGNYADKNFDTYSGYSYLNLLQPQDEMWSSTAANKRVSLHAPEDSWASKPVIEWSEHDVREWLVGTVSGVDPHKFDSLSMTFDGALLSTLLDYQSSETLRELENELGVQIETHVREMLSLRGGQQIGHQNSHLNHFDSSAYDSYNQLGHENGIKQEVEDDLSADFHSAWSSHSHHAASSDPVVHQPHQGHATSSMGYDAQAAHFSGAGRPDRGSDVDSEEEEEERSRSSTRGRSGPGRRGRPPSTSTRADRRKHEKRHGRLWEFIRDLLKDPRYCPSLICWENHEDGVFRFVSSEKVAQLWGSKRGNTKMTYEKLSRAMRYYYKSNILQPVTHRRLVYRFGPNATNWRHSNPNFRRPV